MNAIEILKTHEEMLKQKYGVKRIGIFGSFARGEEKNGSDIDVLVDFNEGAKTFDHFMDLKFFLKTCSEEKLIW